MIPSDIRNRVLKSGIGYKKNDTDEFILEIYDEFEKLYRENVELREKVNILNDGLQYYKTIEKTLQKALVLAQKASDENQADALKRAETIERQAHVRAEEVLTAAKANLDKIYTQADELNRRFELYKAQIKSIVSTQMELLESDTYNVSINDLEGYLRLKSSLENVEEPKEVGESKRVAEPEVLEEETVSRRGFGGIAAKNEDELINETEFIGENELTEEDRLMKEALEKTLAGSKKEYYE